MSPLTKTFVALNVLLSVALAAGVVVFVSSVDKVKDQLATQKKSVEAATAQVRAAESVAGTERAAAQAARTEMQAQVDSLKQSLTETRQTAAERGGTLADVSTKLALEQANSAKLASALEASQSTQMQLNDTVASMREQADRLITERSQLNSAVSDLTNRYEVTERERRNLAEQLTQASNTVESLGRTLEAYGIRTDDPQAQQLTRQIGPNVNGVIRETRSIAGITYATISVGSADDVAPGMRFNVVDRAGSYLGQLTVDTVEANESTGVLTGPAVDRVAAGTEVRTQL